MDDRYEIVREALGDKVLINETLSRHTSFRIGGPADLFVTVEDIRELCKVIALAREIGIPYFILGGGTNILVSDKGVRGLVVANRARNAWFGDGDREDILHAESGASLSHLARQAIRRSLGGLEWAVGIPGTVGGAIVGNAGAYSESMADVLWKVSVLDERGQVQSVGVGGLGLGYRTSRFKGPGIREGGQEVILSAEMALIYKPRRWMERMVEARMAQRKATQPSMPSAGSVFKNPPGDFAGRLIEAAGLKGHRVGDAWISEKHANFIVNLGWAKADDVRQLIELVQDTVWNRFKVRLELEIELVGEW